MDGEKTTDNSTPEPDEPARDLPSVLIDVNETLRQELEEETNGRKQSSSPSRESTRSGEDSSSIRPSNHTDPNKEAGDVSIGQKMQTHKLQENLRETVFLRAEAIPENQMKVSYKQ